MAMSPGSSPAEWGHAVVAWARSRRGRTLAIAAVVFVVVLAVLGFGSDSFSSGLPSDYHLPPWHAYQPSPATVNSPLVPSTTTLELEDGILKHPPQQLQKATPNFHLLMSALQDSPEFCKTTMSAMMLNYPPPTAINLFQTFESQHAQDMSMVESIRNYLSNGKLVRDADLVLIVHGQDTWFQLPSEVMIQQYQNVVADGNRRLLEQYGVDKDGAPTFNHSIVFAAQKTCEGERRRKHLSCEDAPRSTLPSNIYGENTGKETALTPARFLDSGMVMGPAKELRALYEAAAAKLAQGDKKNEKTAQSVFVQLFGQQQLARDVVRPPRKSASSGWLSSRFRSPASISKSPANATKSEELKSWEFAIGLDYTHTLFQTFLHTAEDELVPITHDSSQVEKYNHAGTPRPPLSIPPALTHSLPPFSNPDLQKHRSSNKHTFIDALQIQDHIDDLKPSDTPWDAVPLIQNTYTGAIPAAFHLNLHSTSAPSPQRRDANPKTKSPAAPAPRANISFSALWYAPYARALLRASFRRPQSPLGFHAAAVGGDNMWDLRGGRGGVWTHPAATWFPWGEVDGVCGSVEQMKAVFADGRGVWLHEAVGVEEGEKERMKEEKEWQMKVAEERKAGEDRRKQEEENRLANERKGEEERQKLEKEREMKEG